MKKIVTLVLIGSFGFFMLNGCSTVAGVGKDIQSAGSAVEKKAEKTKKY